jgi:hypothetical protein
MTMTSTWTCPEGHEVASEYCPVDGGKRPVERGPASTGPMPGVEQIAANAWQRSENQRSPRPTWSAEPSPWRVPAPNKGRRGPIIAVAAVAAVVLLASAIGLVCFVSSRTLPPSSGA